MLFLENSQDSFLTIYSLQKLHSQTKMNLRRKSRCKLKIFGSFSGGKSRVYRSDTDLSSDIDKSVPILLGIKHNQEEENVKYKIDRHR